MSALSRDEVIQKLALARAAGRVPDFSNLNLCSAKLWALDLSGVKFFGANLSFADLYNANLSGATLMNANLSGANLTNAKLTGNNLWGTVGNGKEIFSLQTDIWFVTWTKDTMQIGCQRHSIKFWWNFSDTRITSMSINPDALAWWVRWKPILREVIANTVGLEQS